MSQEGDPDPEDVVERMTNHLCALMADIPRKRKILEELRKVCQPMCRDREPDSPVCHGCNDLMADLPTKTFAIHGAVYAEDIAMADRLLQDRRAADACNQNFPPPLVIAASTGNVEMAKLLLRKGSKLSQDAVVLRTAVQNGHVEMARLFLDAGSDPHAMVPDGWTLLQHAIHMRKDEMIRLLLERGSDVDLKNPEGKTALHFAVYLENAGAVDLLIAQGADPNARDLYDITPLYLASSQGNTSVVQLLLENGASVDFFTDQRSCALTVATTQGHERVVKMLVDHGADPSITDVDGRAPLHFAAGLHTSEIAELLLDAGADPNIESDCGAVWQIAATRGHEDMLRLLIRKGARISSSGDRFHETMLHIACEGHTEVACLLLDDFVVCRDRAGLCSAMLPLACFGGPVALVEMLLNRGANIDVHVPQYGTGLQAAVMSKQEQVVEKLLERGANVNLPGGIQGSALHDAIFIKSASIARLLLQYGADPHVRTDKGTALEYAVDIQHEPLILLLTEYTVDFGPRLRDPVADADRGQNSRCNRDRRLLLMADVLGCLGSCRRR